VDKPWLSRYPDAVPAEIDLSEYNSILDIFDQSLEEYSDRNAYLNFGKSLTFAEWGRLSRDFAAWLQGQGLQKGDRIALMMPNIMQYPVAIMGALRAGLVVVNTNPMYTARELRHQLQDSGAKAIVVIENFADVLEKVIDDVPVEHVITTRVGDMLGFPKGNVINFVLKHVKKVVPAFNLPGSKSFNATLKEGSDLPYQAVENTLEDIAFLQYTGGTTGVAKGAMLTHRNMVANMLQAKAWIGSADLAQGAECVVSALPLYHIFALTANCFAFMSMGGVNLLITNPRDAEGFVKELSKVPFSFFPGVNTLFNLLLNTPGFADLDFSSFKGALGGGMAVQRAVAEKWFEVTGKQIVEAYGLTETSPAACINPMDIKGFNGCIGLPISSTDGGIMDDAGNLLPQGETGELVIRGPQVMKG
jgi:long-chain acyl-CoA synthetase